MRLAALAQRSDWVDLVHRLGAAALGVGLCLFGVLGFVERLGFFTTQGKTVLGLSSNGLLAAISVVVGLLLIATSARGGHLASTTSLVVGILFLLSGLGNLAVLNTEYNLLAFRLPNVFFSLIAGILLLTLGAYGRFSGALPHGNPYYQARHPDEDPDPAQPAVPVPRDELDILADKEMAAAEEAVAEGRPTPEQAERVRAVAHYRTHEERRGAWREFLAPPANEPSRAERRQTSEQDGSGDTLPPSQLRGSSEGSGSR